MRGLLIDIDGVLVQSWRPLEGAVGAFNAIRAAHPVKLVTNTTSRTRSWIARTLGDAGFEVALDDVVTAPVATAAYLNDRYPGARCLLLTSGDTLEDLGGLKIVDSDPDVVLLGGAGPEFSYEALNTAFQAVHEGAVLVAMQRNLYWRTDAGLELDTGAFLAGIEQAAHLDAEVVGKPSPGFFRSALTLLDLAPEDAVMVGDDVENDVLGAQRAGITGVLVRTGKYTPETLRDASGTPDHVIDSFTNLPDLLESLG